MRDDGDLAFAAALFGSSVAPDARRQAEVERWESDQGITLPEAVRRFYASPMSDRATVANTDHLHTIERLVVKDASAWLGEGARIVEFLMENQDVCKWAVPLDLGDDPPVLVTVDGESYKRSYAPIEASPTFSHFIHAVAWDTALLWDHWGAPDVEPGGSAVIQAQASAISDGELGFVAGLLEPGPHTRGWPTRHVFRCRKDDWLVTLWAGDDQCDWWVSAGSDSSLLELVRSLWRCPSFREAAWSDDVAGEALLDDVRSAVGDDPSEVDGMNGADDFEAAGEGELEPMFVVAEGSDAERRVGRDPEVIVNCTLPPCDLTTAAVERCMGVLLRCPGVWAARLIERNEIHVEGTATVAAIEEALAPFRIGRDGKRRLFLVAKVREAEEAGIYD